MSVRKTCYNCKHYSHGECAHDGYLMCEKEMKYWELADDAKADLLHDAEPVVMEKAEPTIKIALDKLTTIADSEFEKALEKGAVKLVYEAEHDAVNHPNHYCKGGVECLDAIKAALGDKYEGFLAGNVLKYVYRYPDKNGVEDCKKARFYLDKLIEELSNEQT